MKSFHPRKYQGTWYEQGRYDQWYESNCSTAIAEYKWTTQKLHIENICLDENNQIVKTIKGVATPTQNPGILELKFDNFPFTSYYNIVETDYDTYSIVGRPYGPLGGKVFSYLWILTRKERISQSMKKMLEEKVKGYGFDITRIHWTRN